MNELKAIAAEYKDKYLTASSECMEGEYNTNKMLVLRNSPHDKFPFQFGVRKARLILAYIEEIKAFAERNEEVPQKLWA